MTHHLVESLRPSGLLERLRCFDAARSLLSASTSLIIRLSLKYMSTLLYIYTSGKLSSISLFCVAAHDITSTSVCL